MLNSSYPRIPAFLRGAAAAALTFCALNAPAQVTLEALKRNGYGVAPIHQPKPNQLIVPAVINGVKLNLILDTGWAGHGISLDGAHAAKVGLKTASGESTEGETATGKKLSVQTRGTGTVMLGNAEIKGVPLSFGALGGLRNAGSFQTGTQINRDRFMDADGFISSGFLRTCSAVVDLHNRLLYLRPPGTGRRVALGPALTAVGLAAAPFTMSGNNCITDVEVNGTPTKFIMDTGASLTLLDSRFADRAKTSAHFTQFEFQDAAGAKTESRRGAMSSFKIAGVPIRASEVQITQLGGYSSSGGRITGFMGMDILGQNWSIIDFGEQKLYIAAKR